MSPLITNDFLAIVKMILIHLKAVASSHINKDITSRIPCPIPATFALVWLWQHPLIFVAKLL